jgi:hypothetical protein
MRSAVIAACLLLGIAPTCIAQLTCSKTAQTAGATAVTNIRMQLRAIKPAVDMDTNVPAAAQTLIPQLKAALLQTAQAALACHDAAIDPQVLEKEIATQLNANPPQPPPGVSAQPGDTRYAEMLSDEYSSDLLVSVARPQPQLLSVQFQFHIECGEDTVWILFEQQNSKWQLKLVWQAPPYTEINGAFGDFFLATVLPADATGGLQVAAAHGSPWCTSRFSGFSMDVLQPSPSDAAPKVLWHTQRGYSRGDTAPGLRSTADGFELRLNAPADDISGFERNVIYRYKVAGAQVTRVEPIAANGRGFVEEWLSMPWDEAQGQTAPEAIAGMKIVHDHLADLDKNSNTYVTFSYGPVRSCLTPGRYEVEMDADPGGPEFYAIAEAPNGYVMTNYGTTQDERCSGPNLMKKP